MILDVLRHLSDNVAFPSLRTLLRRCHSLCLFCSFVRSYANLIAPGLYREVFPFPNVRDLVHMKWLMVVRPFFPSSSYLSYHITQERAIRYLGVGHGSIEIFFYSLGGFLKNLQTPTLWYHMMRPLPVSSIGIVHLPIITCGTFLHCFLRLRRSLFIFSIEVLCYVVNVLSDITISTGSRFPSLEPRSTRSQHKPNGWQP